VSAEQVQIAIYFDKRMEHIDTLYTKMQSCDF